MLRFTGTPGFIIGKTLGFGAVKLETIEKLIAESRAKRGAERGK